MDAAVGVLCARVRVEERLLITALEAVGLRAMPVLPATMPLPPSPTLHDLRELGGTAADDPVPYVMIDRVQNRAIGRIINRLLRHAGVTIIDGGVASRRFRSQVASMWDASNVARPASLIAFSEETACAAARTLGFPCTLFPMDYSSEPTPLLDADTADAVIEHRVVLGTEEQEIVLLQQGMAVGDDHVRLHIVDGKAIARDGEGSVPDDAIAVAERAARIIDAEFCAIDLARLHGTWVVWDAVTVADFRQSTPFAGMTVAEAIAAHAVQILEKRDREVRDVVLAN